MTQVMPASIALYEDLILEGLRNLTFSEHPEGLYDPVKYTLHLGGKRIRPLLALLSCKMAGGDPEESVAPALGLELFHNFTLLHDDIMDEAAVRRGQPTVYRTYGLNSAILSGDVMLVKAYELMNQAPPEVLPALLRLFNRTAVSVCEGQQMDLDFEDVTRVAIAEYLEMIRKKTASLFAGCMGIGALLACKGEDKVDDFYQVGHHLGMAFQLQDDLLDSFGKPDQTGKQLGGDIVQNKKTFLLIKAMELADTRQIKALKLWLSKASSDAADKVRTIKSVFDSLDIPKLTRAERDYYFGEAMAALDGLNCDPDAGEIFRSLATRLLDRER